MRRQLQHDGTTSGRDISTSERQSAHQRPGATGEGPAKDRVTQLEQLSNALHDGILKRRASEVDPRERTDFRSNYRTVLQVLAMPPQDAGAKGCGGAAIGTAGASSQAPGEPRSLGPILTAHKRAEREARLVGATSGGNAVSGAQRVTSIRDVVAAAKGTAKVPQHTAPQPRGSSKLLEQQQQQEGEEALMRPLRNAPQFVADAALVGLSTLSRQDALEAMYERNRQLRKLDASCREALAAVRPALLRRQSHPSAISHLGVLREAHDELRVVVKENEELVKINQAKAPRPEEVRLQNKVDSLQVQVNNQLALIKGLRERVKILSSSSSSSCANGPGASGGTPIHTSAHLSEQRGGAPGPSHSHSHPPAAPAAAPRGGQVTIAISEVQSSAFLWEALPHLMKQQSQLYHDLLREQCAADRGYEVACVGDCHMLAFQTPLDACQWALNMQRKLCRLPWAVEMDENPDTPVELLPGSTTEFLWRGLRAKIGIDVRATPESDPLSARVLYEGEAVERASLLRHLALGGEILVTGGVNDFLCAGLSALGSPLVQPWGALTQVHKGTTVHRMIPQQLEGRIHGFQRDLEPCERAVLEAQEIASSGLPVPPPQGRVVLLTALLNDPEALAESASPAVRAQLYDKYNSILATEVRAQHGYLSLHNETQLVAAFPSEVSAVACALSLQDALLEAEWPPGILRVPQFAAVRIKGVLIFSGPRPRIGVHVLAAARQFRDPLTGLSQYRAPDSRLSSILALRAVPGEVLIAEAVVPAVVQHTEQLGHPAVTFATDLCAPPHDTLVRAFSVCPQHLKPREPFSTRSMRLEEEPSDEHLEVVQTLEHQLETLQEKIRAKDQRITRLEEQLVEKNRVLGSIRTGVLGLPYTEVAVRETLRTLDQGYHPRAHCCIVAIGFAHAAALVEKRAEELLSSIDTWNELVDSMSLANHGHELRRLASGTERILAFPDPFRAADFWLSTCRNSLYCDWPETLEDSEEAGVVLASELVPGLHPAHDTVVWKGLRPVAAMEMGTPHPLFDPCARCYASVGEEMNAVAVMLRHAAEGDCVLSPAVAEVLRGNLSRITEGAVLDYGCYARLQAVDMAIRNRVARPTFVQKPLDTAATVRPVTALLVHLTMQRSPLFDSRAAEFAADIARFEARVLRLVQEDGGVVISSRDAEYSLGFPDAARGGHFLMAIHLVLLKLDWSPQLLRLPEFKEVAIEDDEMVFRGIRARVGAHFAVDIAVTLDAFSGVDSWIHDEAAVAFVLSRAAHFGETLMSEDARLECAKHADQSFPGVRDAAFVDAVGTWSLDTEMPPSNCYLVLPLALKARVAAFLAEDKLRADPHALRRLERAQDRQRRRHEAHAAIMEEERALLGALERNENPLADPIHRRSARLFSAVREAHEHHQQRAHTARATLALLESIDMIAEDPFYIGSEAGAPHHMHLLLHQLEHAAVCRDPAFLKAFAVALMDDATAPSPSSSFRGRKAKRKVSRSEQAQSLQMAGSGDDDDDDGDDDDGDNGNDGGGTAARSRRDGDGRSGCRGRSPFVPEDFVQLHIAVERFANLIALHGTTKEGAAAAARDWAAAECECEPLAPDGAVDGALEEQLRELCSRTAVIGLGGGGDDDDGGGCGGIDPDEVRRSIVANLSMVLKKLMGF